MPGLSWDFDHGRYPTNIFSSVACWHADSCLIMALRFRRPVRRWPHNEHRGMQMLKYLITFILSMVSGWFAVDFAIQATSTTGTLPIWVTYVLPVFFGLAGVAAIFISRHEDILMPRLKASLEQGASFWVMVFSTALAGFIVFFLDDFAAEPIPKADRFMLNASSLTLVVLSVLMHLIKRHLKRREKVRHKGEVEV